MVTGVFLLGSLLSSFPKQKHTHYNENPFAVLVIWKSKMPLSITFVFSSLLSTRIIFSKMTSSPSLITPSHTLLLFSSLPKRITGTKGWPGRNNPQFEYVRIIDAPVAANDVIVST